MGLWVIPQAMPAASVHIQADRRLAFEILTAFGSAQTSKVLERQSGRLLVEFHSRVRSGSGSAKIHRTVEWVMLRRPGEIEFVGVEGPLKLLHDRFLLSAVGGCTTLRYESTFGLPDSAVGWLIGRLYVRPMLRRFMEEHLLQVRETIEDRARRSRVYPWSGCDSPAEPQVED